MQKFDIGDVVKLKSGGRKMTVKCYAPILNIGSGESESQTDVICIYQKENGEIVTKKFNQDTLVIAK